MGDSAVEDDSESVFAVNEIVYWDPNEESLADGVEAEEGGAESEAQAISNETDEAADEASDEASGSWDGAVLNPVDGVNAGPSGKETFYNLDMSGVLDIMYEEGFEGDYWINEDGCKMFGDYIMVAADQSIRPLGTIVETSLGTGIVCDTGDFIFEYPYGLDVAVTW